MQMERSEKYHLDYISQHISFLLYNLFVLSYVRSYGVPFT